MDCNFSTSLESAVLFGTSQWTVVSNKSFSFTYKYLLGWVFSVINLSSILNFILFSNFFSYPSQLHSISALQMASHPQYFFYILTLIAIFPALCSSQEGFTSSRATYYGSPDCLGTPSTLSSSSHNLVFQSVDQLVLE